MALGVLRDLCVLCGSIESKWYDACETGAVGRRA